MAMTAKPFRTSCPTCSAPVNRLTAPDGRAVTSVAGPLGGIIEINVPLSVIYACSACEWAVVR